MDGTLRDLIQPTVNQVKHIAAGTATYLLTAKDKTVIVAATDKTGHITVVLPQEDKAAGIIFSIRLKTKDTSDVYIKAHDGSATLATLATLGTSGNWAVLYCDGYKYTLLGGTYT